MYLLCHNNDILFSFDMKAGTSDRDVKISNLKLRNENQQLPLGMSPTEDGVARWIVNRVIPTNRYNAAEVYEFCGLSGDWVKNIIDFSHAVSVNDKYWITWDGCSDTYSNIRPGNQVIDMQIASVALTGACTGEIVNPYSPEFTTDGMLPKAWMQIEENNEVLLYKRGTEGFANSGNEVYSEYFAAQIAEQMGLPHVKYDLAVKNGYLCSVCKNFIDNINIRFVPASDFCDSSNLVDVIRKLDLLSMYQSTIGDLSTLVYNTNSVEYPVTKAFEDMLIFDAVVWNSDRHLGNFGVFQYEQSGKIDRLAPIFDNGAGLLAYLTDDEVVNFKIDKHYEMSAFEVQHMALLKLLAKPRHIDMIKSLIGFKLTQHPVHKMNSERFEALNRLLQIRVKSILLELGCISEAEHFDSTLEFKA